MLQYRQSAAQVRYKAVGDVIITSILWIYPKLSQPYIYPKL